MAIASPKADGICRNKQFGKLQPLDGREPGFSRQTGTFPAGTDGPIGDHQPARRQGFLRAPAFWDIIVHAGPDLTSALRPERMMRIPSIQIK
ncbi:MAG: hypothetical protein JOY90_12595 [Bradyrhizobium sp.]|uniref:hypothetical protein n=1 Tax=Bradyrhizobium sp. TaxID=376 RepID=UPI001D4819DD|nr:hypothetical protein [Bradyrhizobium sp.]MBV9561274.1 hypothetical protein [Bradyrhizobium sp.]